MPARRSSWLIISSSNGMLLKPCERDCCKRSASGSICTAAECGKDAKSLTRSRCHLDPPGDQERFAVHRRYQAAHGPAKTPRTFRLGTAPKKVHALLGAPQGHKATREGIAMLPRCVEADNVLSDQERAVLYEAASAPRQAQSWRLPLVDVHGGSSAKMTSRHAIGAPRCRMCHVLQPTPRRKTPQSTVPLATRRKRDTVDREMSKSAHAINRWPIYGSTTA